MSTAETPPLDPRPELSEPDLRTADQQQLGAQLDRVRRLLEAHVARIRPTPDATDRDASRGAHARTIESQVRDEAALAVVCQRFQLSEFERDVLLLCAGVQLQGVFSELCAAAAPPGQRALPSFALALAAFPTAHWSALAPAAPLRFFQLIDVEANDSLVHAGLRIDERVLHALLGVDYIDERLAASVQPVFAAAPLVSSQQELADRVTDAIAQPPEGSAAALVQLIGPDASAKREIAAHAAGALGLRLACARVSALPQGGAELALLSRLWVREALLGTRVLLLDAEGHDAADARLSALLDRMSVPVLVSTRERIRDLARPALVIDVERPTAAEQRSLWYAAAHTLNGAPDEGAGIDAAVDALASHFDLSASAINAAAAFAGQSMVDAGTPLAARLWQSCRAHTRTRLDEYAQRIEVRTGFERLVLPAAQLARLHALIAQVRQRAQVHERWGFAASGRRGLGISALFHGPSGTGKTLAAEAIAYALELDLYRIDLSQVVSKYIGETEKNLRRVFDAAEESGAILLFDEADALFGKRSEVKDSHDRHANIEVGYLLQRMESYAGVAILTTNLKAALDTAFLRRLRFVVAFPFPGPSERSQIWRGIFPAETPTRELDWDKLARLNLAGGSIRNMALCAAFLAADCGEPVAMKHLLRAAQAEYAKLERALTDAEVRDWNDD